jgi:hypothetical protein
MVEAFQVLLAWEVGEHTVEVGLDVFREREQVAFGDRDGADLSPAHS